MKCLFLCCIGRQLHEGVFLLQFTNIMCQHLDKGGFSFTLFMQVYLPSVFEVCSKLYTYHCGQPSLLLDKDSLVAFTSQNIRCVALCRQKSSRRVSTHLFFVGFGGKIVCDHVSDAVLCGVSVFMKLKKLFL